MIQHEGPGWRFARDSSRGHFSVLLGGDGWAFELNEKEWSCLTSLLDELIDQHKKLESQLMREEAICLEIGRESWWVCLEGDRDAWSLQLVLEGDDRCLRGFEAYWPIPAAQSMISAMKRISKCS
tara:strand:- start:12 stop:386 length:375 start_codon:yes stop_codon:yes gene_type:complete